MKIAYGRDELSSRQMRAAGSKICICHIERRCGPVYPTPWHLGADVPPGTHAKSVRFWRLISSQFDQAPSSSKEVDRGVREMIRLIAIAFALTLATSAQAAPPLAPLHGPNNMITQVRHNCGAGMRWNEALGRCATTSARRHVRRGVVTGSY